MRSVLALTAAVLASIGIGVGAIAAAGEAPLAAPAGTAAAHSSPATASSASGICGEVKSITGAVVHREVQFPQNHLKFSFPAVVRIHGTAGARGVARLLCSLPAFPPGTYNCPVDLGISYNIDFTMGAATATVSVEPGGCEMVGGDISPRSSPNRLWHHLGTAMRLKHATRNTFAGTM
jgi:hypothetical protein